MVKEDAVGNRLGSQPSNLNYDGKVLVHETVCSSEAFNAFAKFNLFIVFHLNLIKLMNSCVDWIYLEDSVVGILVSQS